MGLEALVDLIHSDTQQDWKARNKGAFDALFGGSGGRYARSAADHFQVRAPEIGPDAGVPFAAYIHPSNTQSGPYSGISFVIFPVKDQPPLFGLVVGTQGLSPDEQILGRPGHVRKARAICDWLNKEYGRGEMIAWAKQDPTRTDIRVQSPWSGYKSVFDRYGGVIYAIYRADKDRSATEKALAALLDLLFEERGEEPLTSAKAQADSIRSAWFEHLMPSVTPAAVKSLLDQRRFAIIQGPPGTGKTRMATELLANSYGGFGATIQFHPNTTYENFIGGLGPDTSAGQIGLQFKPVRGALMEAAAAASSNPQKHYLLHIDEINRADLGKVLGEAILLLDPGTKRRVTLPYDFGHPFHRELSLPENLHILGTMNSADRSIAIVDVAVRRRFAFVSLWPSMAVVEQHGCALMEEAYRRIVSIFVEHATDDVMALVPGHSYFLERDPKKAAEHLRVNLAPLLEEYLAQGYVGGFAEPIRGYLQWLRAAQ